VEGVELVGCSCLGGQVGIERRYCIGLITKFNKSSGMFASQFEDGHVVPMCWEMVECNALHFEDGKLPQRLRSQNKRQSITLAGEL
jgi:hypothetical protein